MQEQTALTIQSAKLLQQKISKDKMTDIVTAVFVKEYSSHEYIEEYTDKRRIDVVYTHLEVLKLIFKQTE